MKILVESKDVRVLWELRRGAIPRGCSIEVASALQHGGISVTGLRLPVVVISVTADVQVDALANWLYDRIKDKPARLTINQRRVDIDEKEIATVLQAEVAKQ